MVLTPAVIVKEGLRAFSSGSAGTVAVSSGVLLPSLVGMLLSFVAGLLALRWLSRWLEHDRWHLFGGYCLCAAALIGWLG